MSTLTAAATPTTRTNIAQCTAGTDLLRVHVNGVNALAVASSGRFVLAGMGQEPRGGRWARDAHAKNGMLMHRLKLE